MIVNLYVDHMMSRPPATAEEVLYETRTHAALYADAAHKIGLTPQEYQQFRNALLDGKAVYVRLPHHLDAMAGDRRGYVYAVKHAYMPQTVMGWKVTLADGATVYVPQTCGNLSVLRGAPVVAKKKMPKRYVAAARQVPPAPAQTETPVTVAPAEQPPEVAAAPIAPAAVAPAAGTNLGWLAGIPILGGIIGVISQHHTPQTPPTAPPCTGGSNSMGVCTQSR